MDREHLSTDIKREVRKRCGFGCVMCGSPIFDYEHIDGYWVTGHDPDRMTLLCPEHHREKTAGRLPVAVVHRANEDPFNRSKPLTPKHSLYFEGSRLTVELGSVRFESTTEIPEASIILVDGEPVMKIRFEDGGHVVLDLTFRDADNRPLLVVRRGELRHATDAWDVTLEGTTLIVRRGPGDVVLRMKLLAPDRIVIERAELWASGVLLRIGKACMDGDGIEVANNGAGIPGGHASHIGTLLAVGDYLGLEGAAVTIPLTQRWCGGIAVGRGSFSLSGGGQRVPFTDPPYLRTPCPPTLSDSFLSRSVWCVKT